MSRKTSGRDQRVERTLRAICLAFSQLLREKDASQISVSELARQADIGRRTFYLHYPNTEAVLAEIEENAADGLFRMVKRFEYFSKPVDRADMEKALLEMFVQNHEVFSCLSSALHRQVYSDRIAGLLCDEIARARGDYSNQRVRKLAVCLYFVVAGIFAAYDSWMRYDCGSLEDCARFLSVVVLHGIDQAGLQFMRADEI